MQPNTEICGRLGLKHGAVWADLEHKNLWWFVDAQKIGYGDLLFSDYKRIQDGLEGDEVFIGYNEHHMSRWMQFENAVIIISKTEVIHPDRVPVSPETWALIKGGS